MSINEYNAVRPLRDPNACESELPAPLVLLEDGGVTSAKEFKAAGIHAGFRADPDRKDFALIVADEPCAAAGTFTTNIFCAAPVIVSKEHLDDVSYGMARAMIINSGIANAATGTIGLENARESARLAAEAVGCTQEEVLVASTGVIGQHLDTEPFKDGLPIAVASLSAEGGHDAARAIMTTDTVPKEYAVQFSGDGLGFDGVTFTVGGMAKGSGMIMPNMATMISVVSTDAPVKANDLHDALVEAVNVSFNKITVDSDTSTNDTCIAFASGAAALGSPPTKGKPPQLRSMDFPGPLRPAGSHHCRRPDVLQRTACLCLGRGTVRAGLPRIGRCSTGRSAGGSVSYFA